MALPPDSPPFAPLPSESAVREQLARLLAHPLFANSKRYPAVLAYVVEQTLSGGGAELKERCIGIDVFGRAPTYDASADPIVRIAASEVRKRLSQYYYDPSHSGELVLELPVGSYQPVFRQPEAHVEPTPAAAELLPVEIAPVASPASLAPRRNAILLWSGAVFAAALVGLALGFLLRPALHASAPTSMERFWAPITESAGTATFCLGEPSKNLDSSAIADLNAPAVEDKQVPLSFRLHYSGHLALADVITLTRTAAALETRHKIFRVSPASEATFAQLREGPVVLIGGFDNVWTLRITHDLRYGFESREGIAQIVDRKSPRPTAWATAWDLPYEKLSRDYAIVARIHDRTTGQPVVIAAGISEEGTESAGEILYNPVYLDLLLAKAPPDWEHKDMEAVIETQVIEGQPGPPHVLAVEFW